MIETSAGTSLISPTASHTSPETNLKTAGSKATRIKVVDSLRGFALLAILLVHCTENFDFYYPPERLSAWYQAIDLGIWKGVVFLFSGKAYGIFSLLFGFSFFLQLNKEEKKTGAYKNVVVGNLTVNVKANIATYF